LHSGEKLFIGGEDAIQRERTLLFARVLSANGADFNHGNEPDEGSPSRSHVSAKEFIASNKKAHRSLSQDIVQLWLFGRDMTAMVLLI